MPAQPIENKDIISIWSIKNYNQSVAYWYKRGNIEDRPRRHEVIERERKKRKGYINRVQHLNIRLSKKNW